MKSVFGRGAAFLATSAIIFGISPHALASGGSGSGGTGGGGGTTTTTNLLSIKIPNENVPPGGLLQVKLTLTEPKPVIKGSTSFTLDPTLVQGVAVDDPSGLAYGTLVGNAISGVRLTVISPNGLVGTTLDYPLATVALRIRPDAVLGKQGTLGLSPSGILFVDPFGNPYPLEVKSGTLKIANVANISNVVPGGGLVPAGQVISIYGTGFAAGAKVTVSEANVVTTTFVSSNRIDITLAADTVMDMKLVTVTSGGSNAQYYSYLRTAWTNQSTRSLLIATDPLFSKQLWSNATFAQSGSGASYDGVALQNPTSLPVTAHLSLLAADGTLIGTTDVVLPAYSKYLNATTDVFGASGATLQVTADAPIQMLGVLADDTAGVVAPVAATTTAP